MSLMQEDREDRIRRRAYLLWLDAGLPEGQSLAQWQAAEELEAAEEAKGGDATGESFPAPDPEAQSEGAKPPPGRQ